MEHKAYGIIPFHNSQVLIIHSRKGFWGFPKGHPEGKETPQETALRELEEETGLHIVRFLSQEPFVERYRYLEKDNWVDKQVGYYPAEVIGKLVLQLDEVVEAKWLPPSEAAAKLTYPEAQHLFQTVLHHLS